MQGQKSIKWKLQLFVWKAQVIFYITSLLCDGSNGLISNQLCLQSWLKSACSKRDGRIVLPIYLWSVAKLGGFAKVIGICLRFFTKVSYCTSITWILNSGEHIVCPWMNSHSFPINSELKCLRHCVAPSSGPNFSSKPQILHVTQACHPNNVSISKALLFPLPQIAVGCYF